MKPYLAAWVSGRDPDGNIVCEGMMVVLADSLAAAVKVAGTLRSFPDGRRAMIVGEGELVDDANKTVVGDTTGATLFDEPDRRAMGANYKQRRADLAEAQAELAAILTGGKNAS